METEPSMMILVRLASLVVHVQEMDPVRPQSFAFDLSAAKALANDPIVVDWMKSIDPALLPEKRDADG